MALLLRHPVPSDRQGYSERQDNWHCGYCTDEFSVLCLLRHRMDVIERVFLQNVCMCMCKLVRACALCVPACVFAGCCCNTPRGLFVCAFLICSHQGSFRLGIDEFCKQREAKVMERLEGGGEASEALSHLDMSPTPTRSSRFAVLFTVYA